MSSAVHEGWETLMPMATCVSLQWSAMHVNADRLDACLAALRKLLTCYLSSSQTICLPAAQAVLKELFSRQARHLVTSLGHEAACRWLELRGCALCFSLPPRVQTMHHEEHQDGQRLQAPFSPTAPVLVRTGRS